MIPILQMKNKILISSLILAIIILPGYRFMVEGLTEISLLIVVILFGAWSGIGMPYSLVMQGGGYPVIRLPNFSWAYVLYCGSIVISMFYSAWLPGSIIDLELLIISAILFIGIINLPWDLRPVVLSGMMITGLAYIIIIVFPKTFWHPNNTAAFVNVMIIISLALIIRSRQIVLAGICLGASLAVLWISGSRGGMIAGMVGISIVLLFSWYEDPVLFRYPRLVAAVDLVGSVLFVYTGSIKRSANVAAVTAAAGTAMNHRADVWLSSLDIFFNNPWLGSGPNTFAQLMPGINWIHPHNLIVQILTERGIIGILTAAILLTIILGSLLFYSMDPFYKAAGLALVAVVLIHGLVDLPWYEPFVMRPIIILGALALAPREPICHYDK